MDRVATSDRNFYDRCYFNAHDRTGEIFLVTGLGVYPNLGVIDAYAAARCGDRQWAVRFSGALAERSLEQQVGGYRIEVVEPLQRLHLSCAAPDAASTSTCTGPPRSRRCRRNRTCYWPVAGPSSTPPASASSAPGAGGCGSGTGSSPSPRAGGPAPGTGPGGSGRSVSQNRRAAAPPSP